MTRRDASFHSLPEASLLVKIKIKKSEKRRKDQPTRISKLFMCGAFTARFKSDVGT